MTRLKTAIVALYTLFAGTLGGFFFAFTNPTMMGFANTDPHTYVDAMNQINFAVRNPIFFTLFFLTPALGILAALVTRLNPWLIAAALGSGVSFYLTASQHVPMNHLMEAWVPGSYPPAAEIIQFREDWTFYNTLRTCLSIAATASALIYLSSAPRPAPQPDRGYLEGQPDPT